MLIYNKLIKKFIYSIHIPRTGGRFIRSIIKNDKNYLTFFTSYNDFYKNIEIPHLTYPHYLDLDKFFINYDNLNKPRIASIEHFTVVRNPFDKFKSEMKSFLKSEKDLSDLINLNKNELENLINENIQITTNNWIVPQSLFISPQTKIWKFENGFNVEFVRWIKEQFDFDITDINVKYEKSSYDTNKLNLNSLEKIKPFIEEIYKEDYDRFGYQKDT